MNVPFLSVLVAISLPYVWSGVSIPYRRKQFGKVDNNHPREQLAKASGPAHRASAASANAIEAVAVYAPSVIVAHLGAPTSTLAPTLAIVWMIARVLHGIFYVADLAPLRSLTFFAGFGCAAALVLVGLGVL